MRQILFTIPVLNLPIYGYGAMLVLAFASSTMLAAWRAKREKLDSEMVFDMAFWLFAGGLFGARLFYVIQYRDGFRSPLDFFKFWNGGIVYYGGIFGGVAAFFIYRKFNPFPIRPYLDALAPSIAIGTMFGRLGCFLNGCCFGDVCHTALGVRFPKPTDPWTSQVRNGLIPPDAAFSLPLHPTQLYSAIDALVLLILLSAYFPMRRRDGEVIGVLMIAYPITRFLIEYVRNDEGIFFAGMTISQTISVGLLAAAGAYWWWLSTRPKVRYADLPLQPTEGAELAASAS
ncbi:MAG: prolipoprotein diacylglyceryl transferase [Planctomycetales bacterium 71-10]|nr:MAG: prolipoprotein diacylglyceryl transferase [Planctomycetales bacterium 71-10]